SGRLSGKRPLVARVLASRRYAAFRPGELDGTPELAEIPNARTRRSPGDAHRAAGLGVDETPEADLAAAGLHVEAHLRQERQAKACGDHLHDGGEARYTEGVDGRRLLEIAIGERLVAQAMALLEEQQALVLDQILGRAHAAVHPARHWQGEK